MKLLKTVSFFCLFLSVLYAGKIEDIQEEGIINVGIGYDKEPFGFIDQSGELVGFDVDIVNYIAEYLDVEVYFSGVTSDNRIDKLIKGDIDLIASAMKHNFDEEEDIDFTVSYFFNGQTFLVRKNTKFRSKLSFIGKKIGYVDGNSNLDLLKRDIPKTRLIKFKNDQEVLNALQKGFIDAIYSDLAWCSVAAKNSEGRLKVSSQTISEEAFGLGVPENNSDYRDIINTAIQESVRDGVYSRIYEKWFNQKPKRVPELWSE